MPKKKKASVKDSGGVLGKLGTDGRGGTEMIPSDYDLFSGVPRQHLLHLNNLEWDDMA